jgi:hypothetical protein
MDMGWQDVAAIVAVLFAASYLLYGTWRGVRGSRTGAESCGPQAVESKQLVQIGSPPPRPPQ